MQQENHQVEPDAAHRGARDTGPGPAGEGAVAKSPVGRDALPPFLWHVPVEITVEVGNAELPMAEVAGLSEGTVVELDTAVGQPGRLLAGGKPIALVELVTVEGKLAARVVKVLGEAGDDRTRGQDV